MPLKRHIVLQDLSRDHQQILMQARHMKWIALDDRRAMPIDSFIEHFSVFWEQLLQWHLIEEETVLLPMCFAPDHAYWQQILTDHERIRTYTHQLLAQQDSSDASIFSQTLVEHVRFEERNVFEYIQFRLTSDELYLLGEKLVAFREQHRFD